MARTVKATKSPAPAAAMRSLGRPAAVAAERSAKPAVVTPTPKPNTPVTPAQATAPAPKLSKGELRDQVEKLEQTVALLRAKGREANKAAKLAAKRIAELEAHVASAERTPAPAVSAAMRDPKAKAAEATRGKRQGRAIDPGDAVPPGVAVRRPAPLDQEAEAALEKLKHIGER